MATTSVYGLRYQGINDQPHGPNLGQQLAEDVEAELQRIDAALVAVVPAAIARRAAPQSIPNNTQTDVLLDNEVYDNSTMFAPTSAIITIPAGAGGLYRCSAWASYAFAASGFRSLAISKNNGTTSGVDWWDETRPASADATAALSVAVELPLAAGDTIRIKAWHLAGVALNLDDARLSVVKIAGA